MGAAADSQALKKLSPFPSNLSASITTVETQGSR